jgi:hypothetical protein
MLGDGKNHFHVNFLDKDQLLIFYDINRILNRSFEYL